MEDIKRANAASCKGTMRLSHRKGVFSESWGGRHQIEKWCFQKVGWQTSNGKVEFADPLTNRKSVVLHRDIQMKSADIFVITYFFLNNEE